MIQSVFRFTDASDEWMGKERKNREDERGAVAAAARAAVEAAATASQMEGEDVSHNINRPHQQKPEGCCESRQAAAAVQQLRLTLHNLMQVVAYSQQGMKRKKNSAKQMVFMIHEGRRKRCRKK